MSSIRRPFLAALCLAIAAPLSATAQVEGSPDEIVVTAKPLPSAQEVNQYVDAVVTPVQGMIAVYRLPICPEVKGLADIDAQKVVARVRQVLLAASVPVDKGNCPPNFTIIVAQDGRKFIGDLIKTRPQTLASMGASERNDLLQHQGPAWSWRTYTMRTSDGRGNEVMNPGLELQGGSKGSTMTGMVTTETSFLKSNVLQFTSDSYVVIDEQALDGKTAIQIADYAIMRAIAGARPGKDSGSDSILALFDADNPRPLERLSRIDLAYLTTVYELPMNRPFLTQRMLISGRINANSKVARDARSDLASQEK